MRAMKGGLGQGVPWGGLGVAMRAAGKNLGPMTTNGTRQYASNLSVFEMVGRFRRALACPLRRTMKQASWAKQSCRHGAGNAWTVLLSLGLGLETTSQTRAAGNAWTVLSR